MFYEVIAVIVRFQLKLSGGAIVAGRFSIEQRCIAGKFTSDMSVNQINISPYNKVDIFHG